LHRHIAQTYRFDSFTNGFVSILAAQQTLNNRGWYQGTADAVRQNLPRLAHGNPSEILVLSGDQLYSLRMREFVTSHRQRQADLSIAVTPVPRSEASGLGIMRVDSEGRIVEFVEKPKDQATLDRLTLDADTIESLGLDAKPGSLLASMGMYVFQTEVLKSLLGNDTETHDFGKEVIPKAIADHGVYAFLYNGYWRDIGTIAAFHEANLELYHPDYPIYTHPRFLPGLKIWNCEVERSVLCEGSVLMGRSIRHSVVGIRSLVREGTEIEESIIMGTSGSDRSNPGDSVAIGIGRNCKIRRAIIDTGARVGDGARLLNEAGVEEADGPGYYIRGGIIVVPSESIVAPGTVI
jgi:glucose-1-phosphate adenylyltransferase